MSLSDFLSQFLIFLLCFDIGQALLVQQNQPCNKDRDILLAEDPTGNPQAFLRCTPVGVGTIGFWERRFCPSDMVFDFIKQQCRAQNPTQNMELNNMLGEEHEVKNIAILNGTCAHGEQCIGGTVCDLETLRCLCPYGTIANLETLSCHPLNTGLQGQSSFEKEPTPNVNPSGSSTSSYFKPLEPIFGELKNLAKSVSSSMNFNSFTQQPQSPAPTFSSYGGSNNNNNNNGFGNPNMGPIPGGYGPQGGLSNVQPRPSVFLPEAQPIHPINSLVPPGGSCAQGEQCSGGSVCTKPLNLCLCPGNLQDQGGHCVAPGTAPIAPGPRPGQGQVPQQPTQKVGIGAICNQFAVCDYDSTCLNGRCQCVDPLIEHNGKCVLKLVPKEVGPGELCDNGEVCTKGSICDPTIPVCVCPQSTDLENGECVKVQASSYEIPIVTQPQPQPTPQQPQATQPPPIFRPDQEIHGNSNYNNYGTPPTPSVRGPPIATYAPPPVQPQTQLPYQPPPQQPYTQQTQKPNVMKLNLGGAKQAGVGARCALNTDCMIGAYCNGNTNPPTCQCLSTHVNINGRCEKVIYPGQTGCEYDQQCTAAYAGTSCIDRQCVCPTGSKAIEQTCVSADEKIRSPPGGSCSEIEECSGGSVCREGWCVCPDPTMIVMRGICVQTQPRPTVPSQGTTQPTTRLVQTHQNLPHGSSYNSYENQRPAQAYEAKQPNPSVQEEQMGRTMLPAPRKAAPGTNCGPLDICVGGSTCVDGYCICPAGYVASHDTGRCEPKPQPPKAPSQPAQEPKIEQTSQQTPRYSRPTESCSNGEICTGGSECHEKQTCVCPPERPILREHNCIVSDEKPLMKHTAGPGEECNQETKCTEQSICYQGICRCQSGYIAISGKCVQLPTTQPTQAPTTTRLAIIAGPGEACGEGRTCGGGSTCDGGICQCPSGMVTIGGNCQKLASTESMETTRPTDAPFGKGYRRLASNEHRCTDDTQCGENSICIVGKCKCRTGYKEVDGACKIMEDVAVAHNRTFSSISNSQTPIKPAESSPAIKSTQRPSQSPSEAPRPRIVGPPIRKPKPKTPSGQPRPPLVTGGGRTNGVGVCPPGNEPLRDESSGDLVLCNGMSPNCPPKSYCYVTGMASEEYNCCKSW